MSNDDIYYVYTDEKNNPLYRQVRKNGQKDFCLQRYEKGKWLNRLKDVRKVLYNFPEVMSAIEKANTIYWVEGEKDVETLKEKGLVATTIAGRRKWYVTTRPIKHSGMC